MTLSARLAVAADAPTVQRITDASYSEYLPLLGAKPLPMTADYPARIAARGVWIVSRQGAEIGVVVLEQEPDHLLIFSLAALPEARGGIGRWMLAFAEQQARAAGLTQMRLYTNPLMGRNIRVYATNGYREVGRRPNPHRPGWLVVDMVKDLHA